MRKEEGNRSRKENSNESAVYEFCTFSYAKYKA